MIIQFSKDIILSDWTYYDVNNRNWAYRYNTFNNITNGFYVIIRNNNRDERYYVNFYHQLRYLHNYFQPTNIYHIEPYKRYVDEFLIKMSKLTSFT